MLSRGCWIFGILMLNLLEAYTLTSAIHLTTSYFHITTAPCRVYTHTTYNLREDANFCFWDWEATIKLLKKWNSLQPKPHGHGREEPHSTRSMSLRRVGLFPCGETHHGCLAHITSYDL